jgi:hypothetical protein
MYPVANDERRMSAMRVEAQFRRAAAAVSAVKEKTKTPADTTLGKDICISET